MHRLERPLPWPNPLWPKVDHIERYPHYPPFIHRLATFLSVPPGDIVLGLGIEDFIRTLFLLCTEAGDTVMFTHPTCAMFDVYCNVFNVKAKHLDTSPDWDWDGLAVVEQVHLWRPKLLILPYPGQPVEGSMELSDLRLIAEECRKVDCVFALDEAYAYFGAASALQLYKEFDNTVVLRTFSKAFGGAGLRVGCAIGQHKVTKPIDAIRLSGEITGPSIRACTRLLAFWSDVVQPGVKDVCDGRDWLREKFAAAGYKARGHRANHVLVGFENAAEAKLVLDGLLRHGIHVKGDYPSPLDRHLLITAGPIDMMHKVWDAVVQSTSTEITV